LAADAVSEALKGRCGCGEENERGNYVAGRNRGGLKRLETVGHKAREQNALHECGNYDGTRDTPNLIFS